MKKLIFLVGMMGTGKSTIGKLLSSKLQLGFIDSDHQIEKINRLSVTEIFEKKGEDFFRSEERRFIENNLPNEPTVVSCGGGLCVADGMMDELKKRGLVICLSASPGKIIERLTGDDQRPLIRSEDQERIITDLLNDRMPVYQRADYIIKTDLLSPEEISRSIMGIIGNNLGD